MIRDNDPLTNRYISIPRDYAPLNCASYMGGILRGALDAADFVRSWRGGGPSVLWSTVIDVNVRPCKGPRRFLGAVTSHYGSPAPFPPPPLHPLSQPCTVTTHTVSMGDYDQTVFVIEFAPEIAAREL